MGGGSSANTMGGGLDDLLGGFGGSDSNGGNMLGG